MGGVQIQHVTVDEEGNLTVGYLKGGEPYFESATGDNCPDEVRKREVHSKYIYLSDFPYMTTHSDGRKFHYYKDLRSAYEEWARTPSVWTVKVKDQITGEWRNWTAAEMHSASMRPEEVNFAVIHPNGLTVPFTSSRAAYRYYMDDRDKGGHSYVRERGESGEWRTWKEADYQGARDHEEWVKKNGEDPNEHF